MEALSEAVGSKRIDSKTDKKPWNRRKAREEKCSSPCLLGFVWRPRSLPLPSLSLSFPNSASAATCHIKRRCLGDGSTCCWWWNGGGRAGGGVFDALDRASVGEKRGKKRKRGIRGGVLETRYWKFLWPPRKRITRSKYCTPTKVMRISD